MNSRLKALRDTLKSEKLDAILLSSSSNIYYISAFSGMDSYCLVTDSRSFIITDFRYHEQAEKESADFDVISKGGSLLKKTSMLINKLAIKRVGFEPYHLSVQEFKLLSGTKHKRFKPVFQLLEQQRMQKGAEEIIAIKRACVIAKNSIKELGQKIREGKKEKDIAARLDLLMRNKGADSPAFQTIVASGPNASMPHAKATERRIRPSEPVIVDCGAKRDEYNSDLTRTFFVGKISQSFKLIYNIVKTAQSKAISKVAPGRKISDIDKTARDYISGKGFGEYFGHATGHGIGIDVHEPPAINSKNQSILKEGMVFTVEPGIYIPGSGGVRIEDMVLVTAKGHEVLTR
ncbi:MAG: aminopeptidase P family protein [Candidatus Omnitrophota bacterium]